LSNGYYVPDNEIFDTVNSFKDIDIADGMTSNGSPTYKGIIKNLIVFYNFIQLCYHLFQVNGYSGVVENSKIVFTTFDGCSNQDDEDCKQKKERTLKSLNTNILIGIFVPLTIFALLIFGSLFYVRRPIVLIKESFKLKEFNPTITHSF
jgi:hypothetical protein